MPQNTMAHMFQDHYIATKNNRTIVFNTTERKVKVIKNTKNTIQTMT